MKDVSENFSTFYKSFFEKKIDAIKESKETANAAALAAKLDDKSKNEFEDEVKKFDAQMELCSRKTGEAVEQINEIEKEEKSLREESLTELDRQINEMKSTIAGIDEKLNGSDKNKLSSEAEKRLKAIKEELEGYLAKYEGKKPELVTILHETEGFKNSFFSHESGSEEKPGDNPEKSPGDNPFKIIRSATRQVSDVVNVLMKDIIKFGQFLGKLREFGGKLKDFLKLNTDKVESLISEAKEIIDGLSPMSALSKKL